MSELCSADLPGARRASGQRLALALDMPEGPAVARWRALHLGADLVDGAARIRRDDGAVGAHLGGPAAAGGEQDLGGADEAALDERAEGNALLVALRRGVDEVALRWFNGVAARPRQRGVIGIALDADEVAAEKPRYRPRRPGAEERVEDDIARLGRGEHDAMEERLGLLRRMRLAAVALQPLGPAAERDQPVAAHLQPPVDPLNRLIFGRGARGGRTPC